MTDSPGLRHHRQSGVALLTVMLLLSVMVVIASQFTQRLQIDIARSYNQQVAAKGYWYAMGAEEFLLEVLRQDLEDDKANLNQYWATQNVVFPIEGEESGEIALEIDDMQACFNLNALAQPDSDAGTSVVAQIFEDLLIAVGVESYVAEQLTDATRDWVDSDTEPRDNGGEDSVYESMSTPYSAANTAMADASEWRSVSGVTAAIYSRVRPYICALPTTDLEININTIRTEHAAMLQALFASELDIEDAREMIEERPKDGYDSTDDALSFGALSDVTLSSKNLGSVVVLNSDYFRGGVVVKTLNGEARLTSLIKRSGESKLRVIGRTIGGWQ